MFPTLSLGPFTIPTFTLFIDLGLVGVLVWLWYRAPAHGREPALWLDAGLCAAAGAVLGGRIVFASANWAYFGNHFFEIFNLWEGGYAWPGVALGGLLGLLIYSRIKAEPMLLVLDELSLPALLLSALGWFGCAAAACAAGKDVPPGSLPFAVNWPDLYGVVLPRWPTQIIGLGLSLIAFGYLFSQRDRLWPKGLHFSLALLFVALISFTVSNVRGDDMPLVSGWRLDIVANAAMIVVGSIALVVAWAFEPAKIQKPPTTETTELSEKPQ